MKRRCVIVGASLGGFRSAQQLRRASFDGEITLIGEESYPSYQRPPLSKQLLKGTFPVERCYLRGSVSEPFALKLGVRATSLDPSNRRIVLNNDTVIEYDCAIISTGAQPFTFPKVLPSRRVIYLRNIEDSIHIRDQIKNSARIGVVGAGFIGSEVASSLSNQVEKVVLFDSEEHPMSKAVGPYISQMLKELHQEHLVETVFGSSVSIVDSETEEFVWIETPTERLPFDMVVIGVGVKPATQWLSGVDSLEFDAVGALMADDKGKVYGADALYVVGDASSWFHPLYKKQIHVEHFETTVSQAVQVAKSITQTPSDPIELPFAWTEQYGQLIQTVGLRMSDSEDEVLRHSNHTLVLFHSSNKTTGAALLNCSEELTWAKNEILSSLSSDSE